MHLAMWTSYLYDLQPEEMLARFSEKGWTHLELSDEHGNALLDRGDFDLARHQEHSGNSHAKARVEGLVISRHCSPLCLPLPGVPETVYAEVIRAPPWPPPSSSLPHSSVGPLLSEFVRVLRIAAAACSFMSVGASGISRTAV